MLSFDRGRVDALRLALGASLEELHAIRNGDAAAADVMRSLGGACRMIEDWLPRVHDILNSTAMTSCLRSAVGVPDMSQASKFAATYQHGREVLTDPLTAFGPPAPHPSRTMEQVFAAIESGELPPMKAPMDANGRANAPYESLAFAPTSPPMEIGRVDTTSNAAKFADFWSDGLAVGFKHKEILIVERVAGVRVTKRVHKLTAFDRDEGPDTIEGLTTVAVTSGYLVYTAVTEDAELTHQMQEGGDSTADFQVVTQHSSAYSGTFYPDNEAVFEAIPERPRYESPDEWTFTMSASPVTGGWGTWHVQ